MIPEAKDAPALRLEISRSLAIGFFRVLCTVQLDDYLCGNTTAIDDIWRNRVLSSELPAIHSSGIGDAAKVYAPHPWTHAASRVHLRARELAAAA